MSDIFDQMHAALDRELQETTNVTESKPVGACLYVNVGHGCTNDLFSVVESHNFKILNTVRSNGQFLGDEGDILFELTPKR